jgi:hypothetical protein
MEKPPLYNQNATLPKEIEHELFTNATVDKFPLLNLTDTFKTYNEKDFVEPKADKDYKFVNSSLDYINHLTKIA